jgi:hypothetical protein
VYKIYSRDNGGEVAMLEHPLRRRLHHRTAPAQKYHLTCGNPPWLDDVVACYGLSPPTH